MKWFLFLCAFLFLFPIIGRFLLRSLLWVLGVSAIKLAQKEYNNHNQARPQPTQRPNPNQQTRRKPEGTIDIDYIPDKDGKKPRPQDFRGGEYVDYEEVK